MPRVAYINGEFVPFGEAKVHIEDRGLQFADAVYEVVAFFNGRFLDLAPHLERLERSLSELSIRNPVEQDALAKMMRELVAQNRLAHGIVYLQITRGVAKREHAFPSAATEPTVIATARALDLDGVFERQRKGVSILLVPENRWRRPDIKSTSLLGNVLAKQAAHEAGCYEAVYVDEKGRITEGTSSNIWLAGKGGNLVTRTTDGAILAGITRSSLLKILKREAGAIEQRAFTKEELLKAPEAFLSGTTSFIMPVVKVDGEAIGDGKPGPVSRELVREYWNYVKDETGFETPE